MNEIVVSLFTEVIMHYLRWYPSEVEFVLNSLGYFK